MSAFITFLNNPYVYILKYLNDIHKDFTMTTISLILRYLKAIETHVFITPIIYKKMKIIIYLQAIAIFLCDSQL